VNSEELQGWSVLGWEHLVQDLASYCPESATQEALSLQNLKKVRSEPFSFRHNAALNPTKDEL